MLPSGSHVVPMDNRPRDERRFADREHWLLVTNWHPKKTTRFARKHAMLLITADLGTLPATLPSLLLWIVGN